LEEERVRHLLAAVTSSLKTQVAQQVQKTVNATIQDKVLPILEKRINSILDQRLKKLVPDICSSLAKQIPSMFASGLSAKVENAAKKAIAASTAESTAALTRGVQQAIRDGFAKYTVKTNNDKKKASTKKAPPTPTKKQQIEAELKKKNFAGAFHLALLASDTTLVLWLCKQLDVAEIFGEDDNSFALTPRLLLCLVQQLSANFQSDVSLRLEWLQNCLIQMSGMVDNTDVRTHAPELLQQLASSVDSNRRLSSEQDKYLYRCVGRLNKSVLQQLSN
jgi:hypothetical protein